MDAPDTYGKRREKLKIRLDDKYSSVMCRQICWLSITMLCQQCMRGTSYFLWPLGLLASRCGPLLELNLRFYSRLLVQGEATMTFTFLVEVDVRGGTVNCVWREKRAALNIERKEKRIEESQRVNV